MKNIKLIIEYDGTNYLGWQRQRQGPTIQELIESTLLKITDEKITVMGSGRTDSGVHALAQVANFRTGSSITATEFQKGLNSMLPGDIVIKNAKEVATDFHSQFSAKSKTYVYKILNRPYPSALERERAWYIPYSLEVSTMKEAACMLLGEHDFRAFTQAGTTVKSTVRTVLNSSLKKKRDNMLEFEIEANGFLKRMVRLIVGTLVQVGKEKITPKEVQKILKSGKKDKFILAAPPRGLYLKEVKY